MGFIDLAAMTFLPPFAFSREKHAGAAASPTAKSLK